MLVRLARWLRALGFDAATDPDRDDPGLVELAAREERVLLTRDRHLIEHLRPARALLIREDAPLAQLREVVSGCGLTPPGRLFSRCLACNGELRSATPEEIAELVPRSARELPGTLRRCPDCGRAFWPGSHTRRMRAVLARDLPEWVR